MVSGGLAKMADTARKTTSAIKGTNDTLAQSYDQIRNKIGQLESSIAKSTSIKHIRDARAELDKLQRMANRAPGNVSGGSGGFLAGALRSALPAIGIAGALALGGGALSDGLHAQARSTSFEVMAGKSEGGKLNQDLTKFAQDSIFGNEVYQNAQTMLAFGASVKEVMPDLKMLGDISMGDKDKLGRLTLAFSQVRAAGKLMGQDLLQFVNAGFNPLQIISEKTGMSLGDLRKKVEEGKISFDMVKEAFISATSAGGRFNDMTNKIAQTDFGKVEAFKGQLSGLSMQIGGILAPIMGSFISTVLAPMVGWIQRNMDLIQALSVVIMTGVSVYAVWAAGIWAVATAKTVWALITGKLTFAQLGLNAALLANPIGLVIAAIAGLVVGIVYAWKNIDGFKMAIYGLWEATKQVFSNIGGFFKKIFAPIFEAIDHFKNGDWGKAALAAGKMAFNLTPVGLAVAATSYANEGGFTKGVGAAYKQGEWNALSENIKNRIAKKADGNKGDSATATTPATATVGGAIGTLGGGGKEVEETTRGITGGGPRVINVHINKMVEKIELHTNTLTEGLNEIESKVEETLLRILNSGSAVS